VDPAIASALVANILRILATLSAPIASALKRRCLARKLHETVTRATEQELWLSELPTIPDSRQRIGRTLGRVWAAFRNPGRDLVEQMFGQTGNIVKKLVQAPMAEYQNPQLGLGHNRGIARAPRKDCQFPHDVASCDCGHTLPVPCHRCGPIQEYEHFKTDPTLTSQNLPGRKDQLVSYFPDLLQLALGAVRKQRNRGKMP